MTDQHGAVASLRRSRSSTPISQRCAAPSGADAIDVTQPDAFKSSLLASLDSH
jgi:hypothetical protein